MKKHWHYLKYVVRHKWFVFLAGLQLGVPIWRLIFHDWTKFLPREWLPYAEFFYGGKRKRGYDELALPCDAHVKERFEIAWNHHQHKNDHHWQFWVRLGDDGTILALPMSKVAGLEMIADWMGAGRALGKPDTLAWYTEQRDNQLFHPETRRGVEVLLGYTSDTMWTYAKRDTAQEDDFEIDGGKA